MTHDDRDAEVQTWIDIENELKVSKTVQFIIAKLDKDAREAQADLEIADPHDWKKIQALQNRLQRARSFHVWLKTLEASAEDHLRNMAQEEGLNFGDQPQD